MMQPITSSIDDAETSSAEDGVSRPTPLPSRQLVAGAAYLASTLSAQVHHKHILCMHRPSSHVGTLHVLVNKLKSEDYAAVSASQKPCGSRVFDGLASFCGAVNTDMLTVTDFCHPATAKHGQELLLVNTAQAIVEYPQMMCDLWARAMGKHTAPWMLICRQHTTSGCIWRWEK